MRTLVVVLLVLATGCHSANAYTSYHPHPNQDALLVCEGVAELVADFNDGLLSDAEFRREFETLARAALGTTVAGPMWLVNVALVSGGSSYGRSLDQPFHRLDRACEDARVNVR